MSNINAIVAKYRGHMVAQQQPLLRVGIQVLQQERPRTSATVGGGRGGNAARSSRIKGRNLHAEQVKRCF